MKQKNYYVKEIKNKIKVKITRKIKKMNMEEILC